MRNGTASKRALPRQAGQVSARWARDRWNLGLRGTYYGSVLYRPTNPDNDEDFGARTLFDVDVGFELRQGVMLQVGANNVFDTFPDRHMKDSNISNGKLPVQPSRHAVRHERRVLLRPGAVHAGSLTVAGEARSLRDAPRCRSRHRGRLHRRFLAAVRASGLSFDPIRSRPGRLRFSSTAPDENAADRPLSQTHIPRATIMSENDSGHPPDLMNKLVSLAKRRGFIFQSSEIYGGVGSVYDYGPLGIELKNKIQQDWWREMVYRHENIVGLDAGILMNPEVWVASGHVGAFSDPLVECTNCHRRFRTDELDDLHGGKPDEQQCPSCGTRGNWTEPRQFDLMFRTFMGRRAGRGVDRLSAAGDGTGDLRQLQERPGQRPPEDPVRDRPGGEGVPERDHPRKLHLPDARVRADGDAVLREARDGGRAFRGVDGAPHGVG